MTGYTDLKDLLINSRYAVYATVNEDGSPHNSPLFFIADQNLERVYIGSHPDSLHARNIVRTGKAFAVLLGRTAEGGRGLYLKINKFHEVRDEKELKTALAVHNAARARFNKKPLPIEFYMGSNEQKMYAGDIVEVSSNGTERDANGRIIRDTREVIDRTRLTN